MTVLQLGSFSKSNFICAVFLLFVVAFACQSTTANSLSSRSGYLIEQKHKLLGNLKVYVTPERLRVDLVNEGISYLVTDKFDVIACNDQKRLFCQSPLSKWKPQLTAILLMTTGITSNFHWTDCGKTKCAKHSALKFQGSQSSGKLLVSSDIDCPDYTVKVIMALAGAGEAKGIKCVGVPLQLSIVDSGQGFQNVIDTLIVKPINIPPSVFASPLGYKKITDERDLRTFTLDSF